MQARRCAVTTPLFAEAEVAIAWPGLLHADVGHWHLDSQTGGACPDDMLITCKGE